MSKTKKNENLECICHYPDRSSYSEIKTLSDTNIECLTKAKQKREELGGTNLHQHQINQIPQDFDLEKHGVHSRPCYKL